MIIILITIIPTTTNDRSSNNNDYCRQECGAQTALELHDGRNFSTVFRSCLSRARARHAEVVVTILMILLLLLLLLIIIIILIIIINNIMIITHILIIIRVLMLIVNLIIAVRDPRALRERAAGSRRHRACHFRKRATSAPVEVQGPAYGLDFARHCESPLRALEAQKWHVRRSRMFGAACYMYIYIYI